MVGIMGLAETGFVNLPGLPIFTSQIDMPGNSDVVSANANSANADTINSRVVSGDRTESGQGTDSEPEASAATESGATVTGAGDLLRKSVQVVAAETQLQASVRHKINMFDQQLVGTGHYRQFGEGPIRRLRLELKTQVGGTTTSITQVCDGRHLWLRENLPDSTTLSRIDVRRVRDRLGQLQQQGREVPASTDWGANIAMGGLPRVLAALEASFDFSVVRRATFEDLPVWVLLGQWKPQIRDRIGERFNVRRGDLTEHLPNAVRIVLGRDAQFEYFPREILYLRVVEGSSDQFLTATPLVTLQFYDLTRKVEMNESQFDYQRGDQVIVDRTQSFLEKYLPPPERIAQAE